MSEGAAQARASPPLELALSAAPAVLFCLDAEGAITLAEGGGLAALGRRRGENVGRSVFELYRDNEPLLDAVRRALAGLEVAAEVDVRGLTLSLRLLPVAGLAGARVVGVAVDVTERRRADHLLRRRAAAVDAAPDAVAVLTSGEDVLYANPAFGRLVGRAPERLAGRPWKERLEPAERARLERDVLPELARRGPWRGESAVLGLGDAPVPVEMTLAAVDGGGLVCVLRDVAERRRGEEELARLLAREQAARSQAETARLDAAFLDEASGLLDETFDLQAVLPELAEHCRRYAADACFIDLVEEERGVSRAAAALPEALPAEARAFLAECHPLATTDAHPAAAAMRTGQPQLAAELSDPGEWAACGDPAHRAAWAALAPRAALVVPLVTRRRLLGAMTWMATAGGRRFAPETLSLARDLGRRVALRVENARVVAKLDRLNEFKSRLLAVAGHDLRAPLQVSMVYAQLLLSGEAGPLTKEQEGFLLKILRVINDQKHLVESLMDVTTFGRRRLTVMRRPLDLARVLANVAEEGRTMAQAAGLAFEAPAAPALPVSGDEVRLRQVLLNLVQNATKFTRTGGKVLLAAERRGEEALVSVVDDGVGIPREALARVFDALYQVPTEGAGAPRGLGLGLAIAKELVEAHGGRIWAESEGRGQGSAFRVLLPLRAD